MSDGQIQFVDQWQPGEWECHLFGMGPNGITFKPSAKQEIPNWFWRKMQWLILGNKWVRVTPSVNREP